MKLMTLNVERSRHLRGRILPFLRQEMPDVLCLQELCLEDLPVFEDLFGQAVCYAPLYRHPYDSSNPTLVTVGVGIVGRLPYKRTTIHYYYGQPAPVPLFRKNFSGTGPHHRIPDPSSYSQAVVAVTVGGVRVLTTHLVVTAQGEAHPFQLVLAEKLLEYTQWELSRHGQVVLCGDFNAPRGRATWAKLAERLHDNIPAAITTTIDAQLHRDGDLQLVVDGLFSAGTVRVQNVRMEHGLSDHLAIMAEVTQPT